MLPYAESAAANPIEEGLLKHCLTWRRRHREFAPIHFSRLIFEALTKSSKPTIDTPAETIVPSQRLPYVGPSPFGISNNGVHVNTQVDVILGCHSQFFQRPRT